MCRSLARKSSMFTPHYIMCPLPSIKSSLIKISFLEKCMTIKMFLNIDLNSLYILLLMLGRILEIFEASILCWWPISLTAQQVTKMLKDCLHENFQTIQIKWLKKSYKSLKRITCKEARNQKMFSRVEHSVSFWMRSSGFLLLNVSFHLE